MNDREGEDSTRGWLPDLLAASGISGKPSLREVGEAMDELANRAAPVARSWWIVILFIQGAAVVLPALWLFRRVTFVAPSGVALLVLLSVSAVVVALWWVRWRGMQRTWARARLVAEVIRARLSGTAEAPLENLGFLFRIPELREVLDRFPEEESPNETEWPAERDRWISDRLENQLEYYEAARDKSAKLRHDITRATTVIMDVMLALAVSALVFTLSDRSGNWIAIFGGRFLEIVIGLVGMLLPLTIVFLQVLRYTWELNRRTARFTRQIASLEEIRTELKDLEDADAGHGIILQAEQQMLGEVLDWYYEAETAEQFFQVRHQSSESSSDRSAPMRWRFRSFLSGVAGGVGFLFILRIVLGRAPLVLVASALTLAWLAFKNPASPEARSDLRSYGRMVRPDGEAWQPVPERRPDGLVVIAHGLRDGVLLNFQGKESRWMRDMKSTIEDRLSAAPPNVALVNWNTEATPSNQLRFRTGIDAADMMADVASIRPQAREVGDFLSFRLAQLILEEKINSDAPLHFIGHSAGGFVVSRAAVNLRNLGLISDQTFVTILDTPGADSEILEELPTLCRVEFYVTSGFVQGLGEDDSSENLHIRKIETDRPLNLLEAHSFAHQWYLGTIRNGDEKGNGFQRAPWKDPEPE